MSANPEFPADTEGWQHGELELWQAGKEAEALYRAIYIQQLDVGVGGVGPVVQVEGGPDLDRVVDGAPLAAHGQGSA